MKILLGLFLCLVFVTNSFALPLICKLTKEIEGIDNQVQVELEPLDVSKYKSIRIGVVFERGSSRNRLGSSIFVEALQDDDIIVMQTLYLSSEDKKTNISTTVDNLPDKIRISVKGTGIYTIYIWGVECGG